MLASFSVVPIGVGDELREHIAKVLDFIDKSGMPYRLGAMQTTVEGEPAEVMALIMRCHTLLLEAAPRVVTHIAIDDRKGATGRLEGKVKDVEQVLGRELSHE
ncbi:MAG TPA: MTH1187 family thiamine-binding protein [Armatimonadota bacterium]|nr:MTH1187 family thiamine-binding protein [Armatimonadota bacterium]